MSNPVSFVRHVGLVEGVSFLVLMGVAMPLKYIWNMPGPVKVVGWAHGILFMLLCVALLRALIVARWPITRAIFVFVAALVPFGPFLIDRKMKLYESEYRQRAQ